MRSGEAAPKSPDDYAPEGVDIETMKKDPLYMGFLKSAHSRGFSNADVSWILGEYAQRQAMANSPEVGEAELRKVWPDDATLQQGLARSYAAVAAFTKGDSELAQRLEQKFGNDPDYIRLMANVGKELREDRPVAGITAAETETREQLMASKAYNDATHPDHARVMARVKALYEKQFPPGQD